MRPVQDLAEEALLEDDNSLILAPTAGGKTEAALFPALSRLLEDPPDGLGAIYVAPIKALLNNQAEHLGQHPTTSASGSIDITEHQNRARRQASLLETVRLPEMLAVRLSMIPQRRPSDT